MNSYKSFVQKKSKKYILEYLISEGILTYGEDFQSKLKNISKNPVASSLISIMGDEFDDSDLKQNFISTTDKSCEKCECSGYNPCEECENGIVEIGCKRCDGSGSIECERCDEDGMIDCPECLGGKKSPLCDKCTGLIRNIEEDD